MSSLQFLLVAALAIPVVNASYLSRVYRGHGNAWKEFETLYLASKDVGGGGVVRVNGLPPVMLSALADRIGIHVPSTRIHRAGCVVGAEQLVGSFSRRPY